MTYRPGTVTLPFPDFASIEDAQAWAELLYGFLIENQKRNNAILAEARKVKGAALTAEDTQTVDSTYGAEEADVLDNCRTRIGEIEAILVSNNLATEA